MEILASGMGKLSIDLLMNALSKYIAEGKPIIITDPKGELSQCMIKHAGYEIINSD